MENSYPISYEILDIEEIIIPEGIFISINEIEAAQNSVLVKINKDNILVEGIEAYLTHVKMGSGKIRVIRVNMLQKINISLASAA
jgi:hypothetical protein